MIRNGRPYTYNPDFDEVDNHLITDRSKEDQKKVFDWIKNYISPRSSVDNRHTSYGLKHIQQHVTGLYLYNNEFKDAMMLSGYMPVDPDELNWRFKIYVRKTPRESEE